MNGLHLDNTHKSKTLRQKYIAGELTHREYYGMIVKRHKMVFTKSHPLYRHALKCFEIGDEHFNNVSLHIWDRFALAYPMSNEIMKDFGDYLTLAGRVCIYKEAMLQAIEKELLNG